MRSSRSAPSTTVTSSSRTASAFSGTRSRRRTFQPRARHLETALAAFIQAGIPYRAAQTRLLLAQVLRRNDREVAGAEARAALSVFEDLGAGRDADAAAALLRDLGVKAAQDRAEERRAADQA